MQDCLLLVVGVDVLFPWNQLGSCVQTHACCQTLPQMPWCVVWCDVCRGGGGGVKEGGSSSAEFLSALGVAVELMCTRAMCVWVESPLLVDPWNQ